MLTKIECDKFLDGGKIREPIVFHSGLNVILGGSKADNAVGKSTFLLILDFVFGGDSYIKSNKILFEKVGHHEIKFEFEFGGEKYFFSRSTQKNESKTVRRFVDGNVEMLSINDYRKLLHRLYSIQNEYLSFRDLIGTFTRAVGKYNADYKNPMSSAKREAGEKCVRRLLRMFDAYGPIESALNEQKLLKEKGTVMQKAIKFEFAPAVPTKKEFEKNQEDLTCLEKEREILMTENELGILSEDNINAKRIVELRKEKSKLQTKKNQLQNKLEAMKENKEHPLALKSLDVLKEFFPSVNIKKIEEVESFHQSLCAALKMETEEVESVIVAELEQLEERIQECEDEIISLNAPENIQSKVLKQLVDYEIKIKKLKVQNLQYEKKKEMELNKEEIEKKIADLQKSVFPSVENQINQRVAELNKLIKGEEDTPPKIKIETLSKYVYENDKNDSTGAKVRYQNIFDFTMLEKTPLPFLVQDSADLKQIEDDSLLKIIELYTTTPKQIFIAIDKIESYSADGLMPENIEKNVVLKLSKGHELFGFGWYKEKTLKE
ncbi:MAG: hypothetical protein HUK20_10145 [Fibrobacter sp.]|nr:hypothetical protein [Fibrobacter sp.]